MGLHDGTDRPRYETGWEVFDQFARMRLVTLEELKTEYAAWDLTPFLRIAEGMTP